MSGCQSYVQQQVRPTLPDLDTAITTPCAKINQNISDNWDDLAEDYIQAGFDLSSCDNARKAAIDAYNKVKDSYNGSK